MNKTIETGVDVEVHDNDIIMLGVASVETKGVAGEQNEEMGRTDSFGISED